MTHYKEDQLTRKKFRNWVTFAVVLAMVLSLAVGVSATSSSRRNPNYGTISGTSSQNSSSPATLYTSSSMSKNPDSARFVISVDYNDGTSYLTSLSQASAHGITSFTYTFPIYYTFDAIPNMAYVSHSVQNGTTYDGDYCYTSARLYIS